MYKDNTSNLICTFCNREFETKNVRMKRVLCPECQLHSKTIEKFANGRNLSELSHEMVNQIVTDKTLRYR